MTCRIRLDFKKEKNIDIRGNSYIEGKESYAAYICTDGIAAWISGGDTFEEMINELNHLDSEDKDSNLLSRLYDTLSCDEYETISVALEEADYKVDIENGIKLDVRLPIYVFNIFERRKQFNAKDILDKKIKDFEEAAKVKVNFELDNDHKDCILRDNECLELVKYGDEDDINLECSHCYEVLLSKESIESNDGDN